MATSSFAGIITPDMHCLFKDAIDALLEDKALTACCEFVFGNCKFVDCDNCEKGKYVPGGPLYFPSGKLCPICFGKGKQSVEQRECDWLCVEFNSKGWSSTQGKNAHRTGRIPEGAAETFSKVDTYQKIMNCEYAILNKCGDCYDESQYKRVGRPEFCGLGLKPYILTFWEKV